jgi:hypothetical protein
MSDRIQYFANSGLYFGELSAMKELSCSKLISVSLSRTLTVVVVFATVLLSCSTRLIRHEPHNAAIAATRFVEEALINNGLPNAMELLSGTESSQNERKAKILSFVSDVKSSASQPESIWAIEYEPVPGTYFVRIFLVGRDKRDKFTYYSVLMESSNAQDYKVVEFAFNGTTPFQTSPLRKSL